MKILPHRYYPPYGMTLLYNSSRYIYRTISEVLLIAKELIAIPASATSVHYTCTQVLGTGYRYRYMYTAYRENF